MQRHHVELAGAASRASAGTATSACSGSLELVKDRVTLEPLSPFNVLNETMASINRALLDRGLFTMVRFNGMMTNPPLCITEEQLGEGFAIIDEVL